MEVEGSAAGMNSEAMGCRRVARSTAALLLLAGVLALVPAAAAAKTYVGIPGATYNGVAVNGASITIHVSADGTLVDSYMVENQAGALCNFVSEGRAPDWPGAPIQAGSFAYDAAGGPIKLDGNFSGPQSASGTFALPVTSGGCNDKATVSWSATTSATPPPDSGGGGGSGGSGGSGGGGKHGHRYPTRIGFERLDGKRDGGRLGTSARACLAGRIVTLWSAHKRIASTHSSAKGTFWFRRTGAIRGHRLRAAVTARSMRAGICGAGSSGFVLA
jgi:hypothetical protein